MCVTIVANNGEIEIETQRQFFEHFGFKIDEDVDNDSPFFDCCLCNMDIDGVLKNLNIPYEMDDNGSDFIIR
ncbi:hypothetical protein SAMN05421780_11059 [Flexibacter flexilis DSM 6793]|uniref:Uncharacterized protein n=1 Tax=Flexibacter flexilis DSM 6793 TaxID=927664 RepID=A0A1I1M718_9BACT|nr:hypothetical protein [Flexibacter flexilis]SFC81191.1 hypothetical protein SAMN05421780_11059 [Flexibacter flexilis DSM 6793]